MMWILICCALAVAFAGINLASGMRPYVTVQGRERSLKATYEYLNAYGDVCRHEKIFLPSFSPPERDFHRTFIYVDPPLECEVKNPERDYFCFGKVSIPRSRILTITTEWQGEVNIEGEVQLPVFGRRVYVDGRRLTV